MGDSNSNSPSGGGTGCLGIIGIVLAALMSYQTFHALGWAILAGFFNWLYVIYYVIEYGWPSL